MDLGELDGLIFMVEFGDPGFVAAFKVDVAGDALPNNFPLEFADSFFNNDGLLPWTGVSVKPSQTPPLELVVAACKLDGEPGLLFAPDIPAKVQLTLCFCQLYRKDGFFICSKMLAYKKSHHI